MAKMLEALEDGGAPSTPSSEGPLVGVVAVQGNVYSAPTGNREARIGYIRRGGKVVANPQPVKGKNCDEGWFHLVPFGYVCGKVATLDLDNPQVRLGVREPALDEILPYKYAFNVAHGTPLYRVVPSSSEMAEYEPYLDRAKHKDRTASASDGTAEPPKKSKKRKKKKKRRDDDAPADEREAKHEGDATPAASATTVTTPASLAPDAGAPPALPTLPSGDAGAASEPLIPDAGTDAGDDENKPWWQKKYEPGKGPDVKLSDLMEDANRVMARRMVKGFYVAVDRTFQMNGRMWHKTTAGLIAPADRFAIVKPPSFSGQEIEEAEAAHAVAFVTAKSANKYELDGAKKALKPAAGLVRYDRAYLSGKTATFGGKAFRETTDGLWLRESDIGWTEPGPAPASLKPGEKWIDVNLSRQTLVAFEGTRPVFATLVSTGRKGKDKEHDHTTPTGTWRVREKHIAATMDGDGAAAGDVPYSIEDVPYIQYFHESYALHGAFWHDNFGRQQSHGCVNLAPLDAKRLFFWAGPPIPKGWHGMISSPEMPGTLVVVHD